MINFTKKNGFVGWVFTKAIKSRILNIRLIYSEFYPLFLFDVGYYYPYEFYAPEEFKLKICLLKVQLTVSLPMKEKA